MKTFGVDDIFTPEQPIYSAKGASALTAVMKKNGIGPDFAPRGSLALKPWIANDQGLTLPPEVALPAVEALAPYNSQIEALSDQIGAVIPRQSMKTNPAPR